MTFKNSCGRLLCVGFLFAMVSAASAMDFVTFRRDGKQYDVNGRVLITSEDGGMLLLGRDGVLWMIQPDEIIRRSSDEEPFKAFSRDEIAQRLLNRLPRNFDVYRTTHYLILYDTSRVYAQWCGSLFERLYMAFRNYWTHKGFELAETEFPLVAVIFADRGEYLKYTADELGEANRAISGYYNLLSNRMTMYDLTGAGSAGKKTSVTISNAAQINQILARPEALNTVSTIVHEATHQIAFNCGLQARLSDCPLWLSEGIAMYFETPDLRSAKGWHGIGKVNQSRLRQFQKYLLHRPADSLQTLIENDKRFRDAAEGLNAYAEAWALTYFLVNKHSKEYIAYLAKNAAKKPLVEDSAETRLNEFQQSFGDIKRLDAEFIRYMLRGR